MNFSRAADDFVREWVLLQIDQFSFAFSLRALCKSLFTGGIECARLEF